MALDLCAVFEEFGGEFCHFENLDAKYRVCSSRDICGLMLLHKLAPVKEGSDTIECARHDVVYLATDVSVLAEKATREDILALVQCGVRYTEEEDGYLSLLT